MPLTEVGAEFLFQVVAERAEKAAVSLTINLPFSEWTQVIPNPLLCKALIDRITNRAHIIETGTESYRFRRTTEKHRSRSSLANQNNRAASSGGKNGELEDREEGILKAAHTWGGPNVSVEMGHAGLSKSDSRLLAARGCDRPARTDRNKPVDIGVKRIDGEMILRKEWGTRQVPPVP